MSDCNYIVSYNEPDLTMWPPRHDLKDARVWHVQRDGSVVEVSP